MNSNVRASSGLGGAIGALNVVNFLVVLHLIADIGWLYLNVNVRYTYFATDPPGTLTSDRYDADWFVLASAAIHVLLPVTALWAVSGLRDSMRRGLAQFVAALVLAQSAATLLYLVIAWYSANDIDQFGNLANDPRFCCAYNSTVVPECAVVPFQAPCVPDVEIGDLVAGPTDFMLLFFSSVFWALWSIIMIVILNIISSMASAAVSEQELRQLAPGRRFNLFAQSNGIGAAIGSLLDADVGWDYEPVTDNDSELQSEMIDAPAVSGGRLTQLSRRHNQHQQTSVDFVIPSN
jgi:hypothetical protein